MSHVVLQRVTVIDDLHRPPAENIGRTHQNRISQAFGDLESVVVRTRDAVIRLFDLQPLDKLGESFPVLGQVDAVGGGAYDRYARPL